MEASRTTNRGSNERRRRQRRRRSVLRLLLVLICVVVVVLLVVLAVRSCGDEAGGAVSTTVTSTSGDTGTSPGTESTETTSTTEGTSSTEGTSGSGSTSSTAGVSGTVDISVSTGKASPNTTVAPGKGDPDEPGDKRVPGSFYGPIQTTFEGLTMFRGNASRTYYGEGPVPHNPQVLWKFGPMSGTSTNLGVTKTWTGTGWTGQPCIFERDGKTWVVFGAYDYKIHFLDAETGEKLLPDFKGGDIFKGSAVVDPDGYPLIYMGCRDNKWRIIAIDRDEADGALQSRRRRVAEPDLERRLGLQRGHPQRLRLRRGRERPLLHPQAQPGYDAQGKVTVDPQIVLDFPAGPRRYIDKLGSKDVAVENSPCLVGDRVYFTNSGGLITGLDVSATLKELATGEAPAKGEGRLPDRLQVLDRRRHRRHHRGRRGGLSLRVPALRQAARGVTERSKAVGQVIKLDPRKTGEGETPLVWSQAVTKLSGGESGVWATPCIYKDMLYVPTHGGALLGIDRQTGEIVWQEDHHRARVGQLHRGR